MAAVNQNSLALKPNKQYLYKIINLARSLLNFKNLAPVIMIPDLLTPGISAKT